MKLKHTPMTAGVVVAGGGLAGVCAAISAARRGAKSVLIQDRPVLGGNASSEVRMHICGAGGTGGDDREGGIVEEIRLAEAASNLQRSASMMDIVLYDLVKAEPNLTLLLNTFCDGVDMDGAGRIAAVHASRPSTEERFTVKTALAIDCTGDGRLGAEANAAYRRGREARSEFGESIAPEKADNLTLGSSLLFMASKHDRPMPFTPPAWARKFPSEDDLPHRSHKRIEYGYWWMEWGGTLDTIADNELIRDELLRIALGVWDHIKNHGDHGADNWALDWVGMVPGKRESRRFEGDHILCQSDLQTAVLFDDRVAYGGWSLDLHPPEGIDHPGKPFYPTPLNKHYSIPLRSLYSRNVPNMLMAGRNISATQVAFGSARVMATCAVMGQAVGTAAAQCVAENVLPRDIAANTERLTRLQQTLLRDDAYIIDYPNADPNDRALGATVTTSSETSEGPAVHVINGVTRGVGASTNRWISGPGWPQWVQLDFRQPVTVSEIHLTFDTGLHRPLNLTHEETFNALMARGPQPETVCHYRVEGVIKGRFVSLVEVRGNVQRKRVHRLNNPTTVEALRVTAEAAWGVGEARVFEVRAY